MLTKDDSQIPALEDIYGNSNDGIFTNVSCDDEDTEGDFTNLESTVNVSPIPTSRIHSIHPTTQILGDPKLAVQTRSKVDAMQEELLQFKIQKVWILVDLPFRKRAIRIKWVYRNKKDERGVMVRNKSRIEAIRIFFWPLLLIWDSIVYQMDVKSAFLVYVDDIIFGSTKRSWCDEFEALMKIILKKFDFASVKTASTLIKAQKPLTKDEEAVDVDVHLYRSMIGSLIYLTASRPDIMFAVCACSRFQVTPKTSHLNVVKTIFRYLKGKPKLGLWYPRVLSFDLEAYSDSDYAGANFDRKFTTGDCQFLGRRLISWQYKKQTIVATSTTEAEYVAAANCRGQVLWIQNQMLDYGFNFMNTKIYIDNERTICIIMNPVFHSKTKHIEIMHHFIRDTYEKKLIQVLKIHTDDNVADLLTKAFDVSRHKSWCCQAKLVLPGIKVGAARKKFVLLVTVTTVGGNLEFHEIVDFLTSSLIYHALTAVVITEASIRSSLLLHNADGTAYLTKEAIFQNLALMGVPTLALEGEGSDQPLPPTQPLSYSIPRDQVQPSHDSPLSGGPTSDRAEGGMTLEELSILCTNLSNRVLALEASKDAQAAEIIKLKTRIKKLKKKSHPVISHHRAWLRSVSRLSMKRKLGRKESVSKQGRKNAKPEPEPTLDAFDDLDADGRDYMETEDVVKEGRQSNETEEFNKGSGEKGGSTEGPVSTAVPKTVSTARPELSTARPDVDAARQEDSVVEPRTPPTTTSIFDDEDITMAQTLIKMKEEKAKEKGVSIKDVEDSSRPARSILTLKPLPTIDPKKSKKMQEIARQLQVELQAEVERERQREEEALGCRLAGGGDEMYNEVQAGIDADALFAAKLQQEEREEYTIKERANLILEDGTEIHMLAERKYPLTKETLERMLSLRLVAGTASEDAYTLLRFIQKQIDEHGSHDGGEKDL
ncbi:hypothetical protein Tco_0859916 [Tanacetum coccineum]|uniref:Uncharacterized protein n=1 Tax=Tanacetum coccineum TaxID=301880 RepID=A0ABQ5BF71_9ASTR